LAVKANDFGEDRQRNELKKLLVVCEIQTTGETHQNEKAPLKEPFHFHNKNPLIKNFSC